MCGLTGMLALNGARADAAVIDRMSAALRHRGPDDEGRYLSGGLGFGFRRLSILDLSAAGHQPMACPDERFVIVFNGEIYNYVELRNELESVGHQFRSSGDTEVLLHAFIEWGPDCVRRLNGMWAFLIYDSREKRLFGSRDRFGKKPLYWYRGKEHLFFASEIKAIRASGLYQPAPNWDVATRFLLSGNLASVRQDTETFYAGILQIPPGHTFEVDCTGRMSQRRFWSLPPPTAELPDDPPERFHELFEDAVRLRLRSDVPLAVFLSGGLDSTSVLCAVARSRAAGTAEGQQRLLAISYHSNDFDETSFVDETVRQTGAELIRIEASPEKLWSGLEDFLWFQDEPVHTFAAVIYYELCRVARENSIKVILAGGGADEYLAGYFAYFSVYWQSLLRAGEVPQAWREIAAFSRVHGRSAAAMMGAAVRAVTIQRAKRLPGLASVAAARRRRNLVDDPWYTPEMLAQVPSDPDESRTPDLDGALRGSVEQTPLPLYLREDDRSSMAHGVEARSPFLDYRLVSLAFGLPDEWKLRGPWNKWLLRQAMRGHIPEAIRTRPDKMGFSVPRRRWFSEGLFQPMRDLVDSDSFRERGIYRVDQIRRDLDLHRQGQVDCADRLFNLMQFELWSQGLRN